MIKNNLNLTGIVLCGGKSSRMGRDKGLMDYKGMPLVQYAIEVLKPYCNEILMSANNREYEQFGLPVVPDLVKDIGPIGGIYSCLTKAATGHAIVIASDMPNLNHTIIEYLLSTASQSFDYIVPRHSNGIEPMCSIIATKAAGEIKQAIDKNEYKLHSLLQKGNTSFIDVTDLLKEYPLLFSNINSIGDL